MSFATTFTALIAAVGVGTIVSAIISRQTVISNFRQAWINALRDDLASYFRALDILNQIVKLFTTDPAGMPFRKAEAHADALMIFDRICLRLNKSEHLHNELENKLRAFIDGPLGQTVADRQKIDEAIVLARDLLKAEWEVTKHPWRTWWTSVRTNWPDLSA